ncbi:MAG: hypothetical protein IJS27_06635, partial [Ruminococcus sp.]|nr:hypothetical protein [Ruminococcus sp.]MBQ7219168.1 hypothetical protein [Ruminococcus sp.]
MLKKRIITAVVGITLMLGLYQLLDYLYSTFISRSGYKFEIGSNLFVPLVVGIVIFAVLIPMYDKDMEKSRVKYEGLKEKRHH